jgi:hypothetical protein
MLPIRESESGWSEAKVGVVFRSENHLRGSKQKRGLVTKARFVAVLGGQEEFSRELEAAIRVERGEGAGRIVWLGDGAAENWTLALNLCPTAIQVLDYLQLWKKRLEQALMAERDPAGILIDELTACAFLVEDDEKRAAIKDLVRYYRTNRKRMRYRAFRRLGLMIGSGFVESAHRHVLQDRMKRAGQHWSRDGGRGMTRLRAMYRTAGPGRFHDALRAAHYMTRGGSAQRRRSKTRAA